MSVAVVFDSAGTLLHTFRVAKDIINDSIMVDIETTTMTYTCDDRALITLYVHSRDIIDADPGMLLSSYIREHNTHFGIACSCQVITADQVWAALSGDRRAHISDLQECIRMVWKSCRKEAVVAMASGVMINLTLGGIEFAITSGGRPFPGARSTVRRLQEMGVATYIASGDRTDKLVRIADYLGIPHDNVHGVATPAIKAQVVEDLKTQYDLVVMVGDGINDLTAMHTADIAILSEEQSRKKPAPLYDAADHVITKVTEVADIVASLENNSRAPDVPI
ncbi:MAG: HAD family hydrolase [Methanomicrobiaceae archaeon]|nr:HAD family hydrolase [Methanomicrobiaceae archaeon]